MNSITACEQPKWTSEGSADFCDHDLVWPARWSEDKRLVNAHGKRLLSSLSSIGMLLNDITACEFDTSFTRMPPRTSDCPGVIAYIIGPPL